MLSLTMETFWPIWIFEFLLNFFHFLRILLRRSMVSACIVDIMRLNLKISQKKHEFFHVFPKNIFSRPVLKKVKNELFSKKVFKNFNIMTLPKLRTSFGLPFRICREKSRGHMEKRRAYFFHAIVLSSFTKGYSK